MVAWCIVLATLLTVSLTHPQDRRQPNINKKIADEPIEERLKRSPLNVIGSVIKGAKFLFQSRRPKNLRLYEKHGGYNEAFDDFEALKLDKIRKYGSERTGSNDELLARLQYRPGLTELQIEKKLRQVEGDESVDIIRYTKN